jgi:hypothetical protein
MPETRRIISGFLRPPLFQDCADLRCCAANFPGPAVCRTNLVPRRLHVVRLQSAAVVLVLNLYSEFLDGSHQFIGRNDYRCHLVTGD